jgi:hypothetical protein
MPIHDVPRNSRLVRIVAALDGAWRQLVLIYIVSEGCIRNLGIFSAVFSFLG